MNCDRIARWYRIFEYLAFGRALTRARLRFLAEASQGKRILVLGDGDGRFTAELVKRNPGAFVDFVDLSARMVALAKERVTGVANVRFRVSDARTVELDRRYDLIVTHFFVDCFSQEDLDVLLKRIGGCCEDGARWIVTDFARPAGWVSGILGGALIRFMYFFFRLTTGLEVNKLPDHAIALAAAGFRMTQQRRALGGLLVSEVWSC